MPFATQQDIQDRLGRTLTPVEEAQAASLLEAATTSIATAAGKDDAWADELNPVPRLLKQLSVELAIRVMRNPDGLRSESKQLGATQLTRAFRDVGDAGGGLTLTEVEERLVRRVVNGRTSGTSRPRSAATELTDDSSCFPQ